MFAYTFLSVRNKLHFSSGLRKGFRLNFTYDQRPISFLVKDQLDFDVIWDSLCEDQYALDVNPHSVKTILDLGSNVGSTVLAFSIKYPQATIYAYEPDPYNFSRLQENVKVAGITDRVRIFPYAITDKAGGEITFYRADKLHWSSSMFRRNGANNAVTVQSTTLDQIVAEHEFETIDILKIDIEGAESLALNAFSHLESVRYVMGEIHPGLMKDSTMQFLLRFHAFELLYFDTISGVFKCRNTSTTNPSVT